MTDGRLVYTNVEDCTPLGPDLVEHGEQFLTGSCIFEEDVWGWDTHLAIIKMSGMCLWLTYAQSHQHDSQDNITFIWALVEAVRLVTSRKGLWSNELQASKSSKPPVSQV